MNSHTNQLQRAGEEFDASDEYIKDLTRLGLVGDGPATPEARTTLQPTRNQAVGSAPSTVEKAPGAITSGSMTGGGQPAQSSQLAQASQPKTVMPPALPPKRL